MSAIYPMKYEVIQEASLEELQQQVNKRLKDAPLRWGLAGGISVAPYVTSVYNGNVGAYETVTEMMYYQAMTFK